MLCNRTTAKVNGQTLITTPSSILYERQRNEFKSAKLLRCAMFFFFVFFFLLASYKALCASRNQKLRSDNIFHKPIHPFPSGLLTYRPFELILISRNHEVPLKMQRYAFVSNELQRKLADQPAAISPVTVLIYT